MAAKAVTPEIDGDEVVTDVNVEDLRASRPRSEEGAKMAALADKAAAEAKESESGLSQTRLAPCTGTSSDDAVKKYRSRLSSAISSRHPGLGLRFRQDNRIGAQTYGRWLWQVGPSRSYNKDENKSE
jgi:hypothetical protein